MIRHRFAYHAPASAAEAASVLADAGPDDATVLGGGTWVVPEMSRGLRRPGHVVDLRRAGLGGVQAENGHVAIGATTSYTALAGAAEVPGLLRTMAMGITGGAQIRNRGSVGGSACYASPASDVPVALVALGATLALRGPDDTREAPAGSFFRGAFAADVRPGEVLEAILVPRPAAGTRFGYVKFKLAEGSWPIVCAGCVADAGGAISALAVGGATPAPVAVRVASDADDDAIAQATRDAVAEPWGDVLAGAEYRRRIAGVIARRAVAAARADRPGGDA